MHQLIPVSESLKTLWINGAVNDLVPGGLIYGYVKAGTPQPYASLEITLDETEWSTGRLYDQNYRVTVRVWADQYLQNTEDIQEALDTWLSPRTKLGLLTNGAKTMQVYHLPFSVDEDKERREEQNVFQAGAAWMITIQEVRRV